MSLSISTIVDIIDDNHETNSPAVPQITKKHGSGHHVSIFGAAALLARRKSKNAKLAKKPASAAQSSEKSLWRTLIGSLRPLHGPHDPDVVKENDVEHGTMPPALTIPVRQPPLSMPLVKVEDSFKDAVSPMASPSRSSVDSMISLYSSANDLHALDVDESDEEDEPRVGEHKEGPNEIDLKAEEFIHNFYQEMKKTRRGESMEDIDIGL